MDVAVGLVSWTIPILVPAGYSRYQAGTGQLFADPPLVNLMPLSLAVLAAATASRTAGRSRRVGMARSAGIVLGAGVGSVVIGLLAAALLPAAAFYDPEPTIAIGLVVCALAVSGGWALGRLGWAEAGASVPALRRLSAAAECCWAGGLRRQSCSVDTGDSRFPPPPGQVCVQLSAETH